MGHSFIIRLGIAVGALWAIALGGVSIFFFIQGDPDDQRIGIIVLAVSLFGMTAWYYIGRAVHWIIFGEWES